MSLQRQCLVLSKVTWGCRFKQMLYDMVSGNPTGSGAIPPKGSTIGVLYPVMENQMEKKMENGK